MMELRTSVGLAFVGQSYKQHIERMKADRDLVLSPPYAALSAVVVALRRVQERAYLEAALQFLSDAADTRTDLRSTPAPPPPRLPSSVTGRLRVGSRCRARPRQPRPGAGSAACGRADHADHQPLQ